MLRERLSEIVDAAKRRGIADAVIRNMLKEALQYYVLDYIYNRSGAGKSLLFTGGSCLRVCFGLNRLSEDIDLDNAGAPFDREALAKDILNHIETRFLYGGAEYSISGARKKIYLKFPLLRELGVAKETESDKLYVKVEIEDTVPKGYKSGVFAVSRYELNFVVRHYDLPTLMANKMVAVCERTFAKGKNDRISFKGRDYYDLLWFLQKKTKPNMDVVRARMKIDGVNDLLGAVSKKVNALNAAHLKEDLVGLFEDTAFIENYCENYKELYLGAIATYGG